MTQGQEKMNCRSILNKWFDNYLNIPFHPGSNAPLGISCRSMAEDQQGNVYIEDHNALYILRSKSKVAEQIFPKLNSRDQFEVPRYLFTDSDGEIWMLIQQGLVRYDPLTGNNIEFDDPSLHGSFSQIFEDKQGRFWMQWMSTDHESKTILFDTEDHLRLICLK